MVGRTGIRIASRRASFWHRRILDGFLNIRDLPRRLTQVNTQIATPFILSSRGFGLLWHNYGLTEFNPSDVKVALAPSDPRAATAVDVTTTEGTRREVRQEQDFGGRFAVSSEGRYAFFLDCGQKMARRWQVSIDGHSVVNFTNLWAAADHQLVHGSDRRRTCG